MIARFWRGVTRAEHWESWDAIRAFAGDDPETSDYYPEDDEYLLETEPHVTHYEVPVRE
jgi:hypothetical protein